MSYLVFDGEAHTLTLYDAQGKQVGQWPANNIVDRGYVANHHGLPFVPNGTYTIEDQDAPHTHGRNNPEDSLNGAYGRFGIIRLDPFTVDGRTHAGVGIHSGRASAGAQNHASHGCIRTVDAAMEAITKHIADDPLETIRVQNNHDQHPSHPPRHRHRSQHPTPSGSSPAQLSPSPSPQSGSTPMT